MAHIAMISVFPPIRGGIAQFGAAAVSSLEARGHAMRRVSFSRLYPRFVHRWTAPFDLALAASPDALLDSMSPRSWAHTGDLLRAEAPDFVLAAYWTSPLAPAIGTAAGRSGRPVVGLVHNLRPHERMPGSEMAARWITSRFSAIIALSPAVADQIAGIGYKGPVHVTPHPVYDHFGEAPERAAARRQLGLDPDRPVILFFGLIRQYKGLDLAVEALAAVRERVPGVTLLVAGEWFTSRRAIQDKVDRLGLAEQVVIRDGYVADEVVPLLFGAADVVALPYRSGTQSGVLMTAASYGVPAVVTDLPAIAAPVREYGAGIVTTTSPDPLAEALVESLDPAVNRRLREGARRLVSAYGWDRFAETVERAADSIR